MKLNLQSDIYKGYTTCRAFGGMNVPVPLQSLALRDYCNRNDIKYGLHSSELNFPQSYLVLESIASEAHKFSGILMCSMHMLPKNKNRRTELLGMIFERNCTVHFTIDNIVLTEIQDLKFVDDILSCYKLSNNLMNNKIDPRWILQPHNSSTN